jgi:hypothetical protein
MALVEADCCEAEFIGFKMCVYCTDHLRVFYVISFVIWSYYSRRGLEGWSLLQCQIFVR